MNRFLQLSALFLLVASALATEVTEEKDCKCWEDFKPEKQDVGGYICRGSKHDRIFQCNDPNKPPICKCEKDGKIIELDLGEINCLSVDLQNGRWCKNKTPDWDDYFKIHPELNTYDK